MNLDAGGCSRVQIPYLLAGKPLTSSGRRLSFAEIRFYLPRSVIEWRYCRRMPTSTHGRIIAAGTGLVLSVLFDAPAQKWMPRSRTPAYAVGLMVAAAVYPVARQGRKVDASIRTREWSAAAATGAVLVGGLVLPPSAARRLVATGWALHPIFDLLHECGSDSRLPDWYPAMCAGYDLGVAGLLAAEPRNFI